MRELAPAFPSVSSSPRKASLAPASRKKKRNSVAVVKPISKFFRCNTSRPSRMCCKQRTCTILKPFRCNTYKKQGGPAFAQFLCLYQPLHRSKLSLLQRVRRVPSSVSCKSCPCQSYAKYGGVARFFPIWNALRRARWCGLILSQGRVHVPVPAPTSRP